MTTQANERGGSMERNAVQKRDHERESWWYQVRELRRRLLRQAMAFGASVEGLDPDQVGEILESVDRAARAMARVLLLLGDECGFWQAPAATWTAPEVQTEGEVTVMEWAPPRHDRRRIAYAVTPFGAALVIGSGDGLSCRSALEAGSIAADLFERGAASPGALIQPTAAELRRAIGWVHGVLPYPEQISGAPIVRMAGAEAVH